MLLFYVEKLAGAMQPLTLPEEEAKHLKVLRMRIGDTVHITDGKGNLAQAILTTDNPKKCLLEISKIEFIPKKYPYHIHIAIAPTKNIERIEWFVEKCVEMGIDEISFVQTEHTERSYFNAERIHKKAIAALKQSLQYYLPQLNNIVTFKEFLQKQINHTQIAQEKQQNFIAYVDMHNRLTLFQATLPLANYCVLIGPEGDFSPEELQQAMSVGFTMVSLGKNRLRTETAGVVACHTLHIRNE
jgi:16S rRNA (uracil1498-N3)-methyltransferase